MRILIASSIHKDAIDVLERDHTVTCMFGASEEELLSAIQYQDILVFRSGVQISTKVLEAALKLKLIIRAGSGMDNIDFDYVQQNRIPLIRIPEPGAKAVAEMSFAHMLALSRHVLIADRLWRNGHWTKPDLNGYTLSGKVLGIVGAGNIGRTTGRLGVAWGMTVLGCIESPSDQDKFELASDGIELCSFENVLEKSDYISVHVPLLPGTRDLIDAAALARVRKDAYLINLARGGVVNEQALYDALVEGRLRGAGLDVHAHEGEGNISPFAELDNVILTPHIGANSFDAQEEIGEIVIDKIESFSKSMNKVA